MITFNNFIFYSFKKNRRIGSRFLLVLLVFLLLFLVNELVVAQLSCTITNSCSNTPLIGLKNDTGGYNNAHAELGSLNNYSYKLCCSSSTQTVSASCSTPKSAYFLRLSNDSNAHAQNPYYAAPITYPVSVCLGGVGTASCYASTSSCQSPYQALISMASSEGDNNTNAHLGNSTHYSLRMCCFLNSLPTHNQPLLTSSSGNNLTTDDLTVTSQNAADVDGQGINWSVDWRLNGQSIAVLNAAFNENISDESGAFVKDYSTFGNNGTLGGGVASNKPSWTRNGKVGGAYVFDGVNDYISVADDPSLDLSDEFTIAAWVNTLNSSPGGSDIQVIVAKWQDSSGTKTNYHLAIQSDGRIRFMVSNSSGTDAGYSVTSTQSISSNQWHFIAATFNRGVMAVYIDGVQRGSGNSGFSQAYTTTNYLSIGSFNFAWGVYEHHFNGTIDEVRIYNRSLSSNQINQLYNDELNPGNSRTIVSDETTKGDTWTAAMTPFDGWDDGQTRISNSLTIENGVPPTPTPVYPVSTSITNRTPTFNWTVSVDPDGDPVTYEINVTAPSGLGCFGFTDTSIPNNYFASPVELCTDLDYASGSYSWRVRACDSTNCSSWSSPAYFNVTSIISITLTNSNVNFGTLNIGESDNTTDNNPLPLIVNNDGNVRSRISARALSSVFSTEGLNTSYFQMKAREGEPGSINTTSSTTNWVNVSDSSQTIIRQFQYQDSNDEAYIDLLVRIPWIEPPGNKQTTIMVEAAAESPS